MDTSTGRPPVDRTASRRAQALARLDEAAVATAVRTGVSPRAVVGALVVVVLLLGVLALRVVLARSAARPEPLAPASAPSVRLAAETAVSGTSPSAAGTATATATATGSPGTVLVHVVGQVRRPGVVTLAAGARVQDAVAAAGGATAHADLAAVNLARVVVDGEQIVVPRPGQTTPPASGAVAAGGAGGGDGAAPAVVDLNAATEAQLDALPGIGPVLAGRIVAFRSEHGRFTSVDELSEVSGIGDALLERLRPQVRV